jgi:3-hydroxyisobutyrate dehydrogenase
MTTYCPVPGPVPASPANRGYTAGFTASMMLKDLKLAHAASDATGAATALGAHAAELYQRYCDAGNAHLDFSGIMRMVGGR